MAAGDEFAAGQFDAGDLAALLVALATETFDLARKTDFSAQGKNAGAHVLDHLDQAESADVRLAQVENFFRRAGAYEFLHDLASQVARVLDLAVELAVGKRAGAAFAELDVGFRIQHLLAPQSPGVLGPFAHGLAAFENDRAKAHLCQNQSGHQSARAEADDDRAFAEASRSLGGEAIVQIGGRDDFCVVLQAQAEGLFVTHAEIDLVNQHDGRFLARIVAALGDAEVQQLLGGDAQTGAQGRTQGVIGVVQRQFQFGQAEHLGHFPRSSAS